MMTASPHEEDALVLRVWHEPGFRARVTAKDPSGAARSLVLSSPDEVMAYVRQWVADTEPWSPDDIDPEPPARAD